MQVLSNVPYSGQQEMVSGFRILASEPASGGKTGFRYLGNIQKPSIEPKADFAEIYNTATGFDVMYRKIAIKYGVTMKFSTNDLFARNYERNFMGNDQSKVAANANATAGPDLVIAGVTGDDHGLTEGRQTGAQLAAVTVYNVTDSVLLVAGTDYDLVQVYGWTFVRMKVDTKAGKILRIGTGATAVVAYNFNLLAHFKIAPITRAQRTCSIILQAPSKSGGSWEYIHTKADLAPDGSLDPTGSAPTDQKFTLTALDDSVANPNFPFGYIRHYGPDDQGVALI